MNKLIAFGMAALVWMVSGAAVASAAYSNASLAGTWVCVGGGSTQVKDAKGASSWAPTSLSGIFTLDAKGNFTAGFLPMAHQGTILDAGAKAPVPDLFPADRGATVAPLSRHHRNQSTRHRSNTASAIQRCA